MALRGNRKKWNGARNYKNYMEHTFCNVANRSVGPSSSISDDSEKGDSNQCKLPLVTVQ